MWFLRDDLWVMVEGRRLIGLIVHITKECL